MTVLEGRKDRVKLGVPLITVKFDEFSPKVQFSFPEVLHTYSYNPGGYKEISSTYPRPLPINVPFLKRYIVSSEGPVQETLVVVG